MLPYLSLFICLSLFVYSLLAIRAEKGAHIQKRINYYFTSVHQEAAGTAADEELTFSERILRPIWEDFKKKTQRKLNKEKAVQLELKLAQAGYPFGLSTVEFKIVQLGLAGFFAAAGFGYTFLLGLPLNMKVAVSLVFLLGAMIIPKQFLKMKTAQRNKLALKELPDTLDLLTISLEAGLGFDAALSKVVSKREGTLSEEFKLVLEEIRLGKTRKEALNNIQQRLPVDDLKTLVYSIIQAEKLGIGMVSVLRAQTGDIREKRRQRAEEAAMKAPIKMLFPLVFFIFPTLFIILLGPAILQMMDTL